MNISSLTTTEAVRAVIGVSEEHNEFPDQYFIDRELDRALLLEFVPWIPGSISSLSSAANEAPSGSQDALLWWAIRQAATYWCAWACLNNAGTALFYSLEDGQNKVVRPKVNYKELANEFLGAYYKYKEQALDLVGSVSSSSVSWAAGVSSPLYDPVTG